MTTVEDRLLLELEKDEAVKILHRSSWLLPVQETKVDFERTIHRKMDILMKMMLLSFQKTEITSAEELSELLFVDLLFIRDLIDKMSGAKLIDKQAGKYHLTENGQMQLDSGIFEHEPEADTKTLLYSAFHERYYPTTASSDEELDYFRYEAAVPERYTDNTKLLTSLENADVKQGEKEVLEIISKEDVALEGILCCEFHLHNEATDTMYARVWNTATEVWDEVLEEVVNKEERGKWRERYFGVDNE